MRILDRWVRHQTAPRLCPAIFAALLFLGSLFAATAAHAASDAELCDQLAADKEDLPAGAKPVEIKNIDYIEAIPACLSATKQFPENIRLAHQLRRAQLALKLDLDELTIPILDGLEKTLPKSYIPSVILLAQLYDLVDNSEETALKSTKLYLHAMARENRTGLMVVSRRLATGESSESVKLNIARFLKANIRPERAEAEVMLSRYYSSRSCQESVFWLNKAMRKKSILISYGEGFIPRLHMRRFSLHSTPGACYDVKIARRALKTVERLVNPSSIKHSVTLLNLGIVYRNGILVLKNPKKADYYFRKFERNLVK